MNNLPASIRQINEWLRSLPRGGSRRIRERHQVLTRKDLADWLGYETVGDFDDARIRGWTQPMQHQLSLLMRALNEGTMTVSIAPDGCAVFERKPAPADAPPARVASVAFDATGKPSINWSK